MRAWMAAIAALGALSAACGEDKNYGDPLDDPNAVAHANAAVTNTAQLTTDTTNETALNALNALSGNYNLLAGIKLQYEQGGADQPAALAAVDDACVVVSDTGVVYTDCDWAGNVVNGSVMRSGDDVAIDLDFYRSDTDTSTAIDIRGAIAINDTEMTGYIDFGIEMDGDGFSIDTTFDGDFDIALEQGCPVDGQLEIHASARGNGQSQSVWVKAEYGPTCGDVAVY